MRSLDEVVREIGKEHGTKGKSEKELKKLRDEFFALATQEKAKGSLAVKVVNIPEGKHPGTYIETHYPGWRIIQQDTYRLAVPHDHPNASTSVRVTIEEDPAFLPFIHILDGMKYQRNVVQGQPLLDEEKLQAEDIDLWARITRIPEPWASILGALTDADVTDWVEIEHIPVPREPTPPDTWSEEDMIAITPYLVPAPITLKLEPPRKAEPEDEQ